MNIRTTASEIRNSTADFDLWKVGYCGLQNTLRGVSPVAHTVGIYGWNFDAYQVGDYVIETGYRNMDGHPLHADGVEERSRSRWARCDRGLLSWEETVRKNLDDLRETIAAQRRALVMR